MFKDYQKYLATTLKVYLFVLVIIFILKIVGLDYFGIDVNNPIMIKINNFILHWKIDYVCYFISLYIQFYLFLGIVCKVRRKFVIPLIATIINTILQIILMKYYTMDVIYYICSFIIMLVCPMIVSKKIYFGRTILIILLLTFYQFISMFIRSVGFKYDYGNLLVDIILNIDQLLLLAITYNVVFMKGDNKRWEQAVGLSSLKKINLKKSLQKLQKNFQNSRKAFKKQSKEEKLTIIIFSILSLIWNVLTVIIILFIAKLNDTLIECIFILSSFWLSKRSFGEAFHFNSMAICFIVSNLTYYFLNRITTPLGISILIPILLGVGLSYFTSKFVKKTYKPLYRGMPKDLFEETILKIVDKDSDKYKICYEFYIDKKSDLSLSYKYNYSVSGIRKIRDRINEKIKRL